MKKETTVWDKIKDIYLEKFNVPKKTIDYIAVQKILKCCVDGYKNPIIAELTKQKVGYVNDVIVEFFHFYGWKESLDIAPLYWYNKNERDFKRFSEYCYKESYMMTPTMIRTAFDICTIYTKILMEINKYYANS